jgi:hypothetical protein
MKELERKPEIVDAAGLNKFLLGTIAQVRRKEIAVEEAECISKLADKVVKLNLVRLMYKKSGNSDTAIDFFEN